MIADELLAVAQDLAFIRETEGLNRGRWVAWLQEFCHGRPGDPWCCDFESFVEHVAYHGHPPTKRTGACQEKLDDCRRLNFMISAPTIGCLVFTLTASGHAIHIGIVTDLHPLTAIAGNTSEDGLSINGDGVHTHPVRTHPSRLAFAQLPEETTASSAHVAQP